MLTPQEERQTDDDIQIPKRLHTKDDLSALKLLAEDRDTWKTITRNIVLSSVEKHYKGVDGDSPNVPRERGRIAPHPKVQCLSSVF